MNCKTQPALPYKQERHLPKAPSKKKKDLLILINTAISFVVVILVKHKYLPIKKIFFYKKKNYTFTTFFTINFSGKLLLAVIGS